MAGPMHAVIWPSGYDNVVDMIDSSAYAIEDEIMEVPVGTYPGDFLISKYIETGKLPKSVQPKSNQKRWDFDRISHTFHSAPFLPFTPSPRGLTTMYPWARQQCLPLEVNVVSIKHNKDRTRFCDFAQTLFPDGLLSKKVFCSKDYLYMPLNCR